MGIELWSNGVNDKDLITKAQSVSGGSSSLSRGTVSLTINPISPSEVVNSSINIAKSALIYSISISQPSWFVLYNSEASRTADSSRLNTEDPNPSSGVLLEIINADNTLISLSPLVTISNTSGTISYPFRITNNSTNTSIVVLINYLILES